MTTQRRNLVASLPSNESTNLIYSQVLELSTDFYQNKGGDLVVMKHENYGSWVTKK